MDATDRKILARLQIDASLSHAELGELVNLSASQVSRRVQRLEQDGIIRKQVILLDEEAVGLQVEAYVSLSLASYNPGDIARFHERMCSLEEVLECCATTGGEDYFLRVVSRDLRALARLINEDLLGHGDVTNVRSSVVLERIKRTTALPLP